MSRAWRLHVHPFIYIYIDVCIYMKWSTWMDACWTDGRTNNIFVNFWPIKMASRQFTNKQWWNIIKYEKWTRWCRFNTSFWFCSKLNFSLWFLMLQLLLLFQLLVNFNNCSLWNPSLADCCSMLAIKQKIGQTPIRKYLSRWYFSLRKVWIVILFYMKSPTFLHEKPNVSIRKCSMLILFN